VPAKLRHPKERRLQFSPEVVALFRALECTPMSGRRSAAFQDRDRELARLLDLEIEWICDCRSVLERGPPPPPSFDRPVLYGQRRVYQTRLALIEAAAAKTERAIRNSDPAPVG
jgi:hypothetical protein